MKTEFESLTNSKVEHHRPIGGGDDDDDHLIGGSNLIGTSSFPVIPYPDLEFTKLNISSPLQN